MKKLTDKEVLGIAVEGVDIEEIKSHFVERKADQLERAARREDWIKKNTLQWLENGEALRVRREEHGMSLREVGNLLGTSATRVRKLEIGEPVSMAKHLTKSYELLLDHLELHAALLDLRNNHQWRF